jgi:hypothetical protein
MLLIIVILLVAYIIVPLVDLTLKDQALFFVKLLVLVLTTAFILWALYGGRSLV